MNMKAIFIAVLSLALPVTGFAQTKEGMSVTSDVRQCRAGLEQNMPLIAWGPDAVVWNANGGDTSPGGMLAAEGWELSLSIKDDFAGQLQDYVTCNSPFLRGTLGMLQSAAPVTEANPATEQVIIYQHSWSIGDGIVGGPGIRTVADLVGKRVAVQRFGPHVAFLARILSDAGHSIADVEIVWVDDLTGAGDTPLEAFVRGDADAAAVILPDARVATSGGNVGTGAEGSVQGATIIFSTTEAASVIGDYIAVRRDFFEANYDDLAALVNVLFLSEEAVRAFMAVDGSPEQTALAEFIANDMLGGLPTEEGVFLWRDSISQGWAGNAEHFTNATHPRRFEVLQGEVGASLYGAKVIDRPYLLAHAGWDYVALADGLTDVSPRQIAAFDPTAAADAVDHLRKLGELDNATRISTSIYFEPNSNNFPASFYADDFAEIVRLAATYSGAIVTIEGHSDPLHFLRREINGAPSDELRGIRTAAENLSLRRANQVLAALQSYAASQGVSLVVEQFTVDGLGIDDPLHNPPKSEAEWKENMRVVFRVLTTQAEATEFSPL